MNLTHQTDVHIFKAFAEENRLKILAMLQEGEKCACTLEEALPISQSTLSHHMKILVESGVVKVRKDKKWSYYALSNEGAAVALEKLKVLLTISPTATDTCECDSSPVPLVHNTTTFTQTRG